MFQILTQNIWRIAKANFKLPSKEDSGCNERERAQACLPTKMFRVGIMNNRLQCFESYLRSALVILCLDENQSDNGRLACQRLLSKLSLLVLSRQNCVRHTQLTWNWCSRRKECRTRTGRSACIGSPLVVWLPRCAALGLAPRCTPLVSLPDASTWCTPCVICKVKEETSRVT